MVSTRSIFYDGAFRPIEEALCRVSTDVVTFLDDAVQRYERSGRAWSVLLADHRLPQSLSGEAGARAANVCFFEVALETLVITPLHHFRSHLDMIHRFVANAPWCCSVKCDAPSEACFTGRICISFDSLRLERHNFEQIAVAIKEEAEAVRRQLRRGIDAFCAIVRPETLMAAVRLDSALRAVDDTELAKQHLLELSNRHHD